MINLVVILFVAKPQVHKKFLAFAIAALGTWKVKHMYALLTIEDTFLMVDVPQSHVAIAKVRAEVTNQQG